jgi:hypothetical protein
VHATNEHSVVLEANSADSEVESDHEDEVSTVQYIIPMKRVSAQIRVPKHARPQREKQQPKMDAIRRLVYVTKYVLIVFILINYNQRMIECFLLELYVCIIDVSALCY